MRTPDHPFLARRYRLLAAAGALIAAVLFLLTYVPDFEAHRPPTESETAFSFFAERLGEAALCEKISWAAYQSYNVFFGSGGHSFARSDCYENVAVRNHDFVECWKVRPLVDVNPMSKGHSALSCLHRVAQGGRSYVSLDW